MATKLGKCSACSYAPTASDAQVCPRCGVRNPNPSLAHRMVGWSLLLGFSLGALVGAVWGFFAWQSDGIGAFGGGMLGATAGFILGLGFGITFGAVAGFIDLLTGLFRRGESPALPYWTELERETVEENSSVYRLRAESDAIYDPNQ